MATSERNIVIVGGGIIGCCSAYFLTRHSRYDAQKHKITLLESSSKIAGGSSGKAGGLLASWAFPSSLAPLSFDLHKELAKEHHGTEQWGYRPITCGEISCRGRPLDTTGIGTTKSRTKPAGVVPTDLDWIEPDCVKSYVEIGGDDITAQVHPFQFTSSIAELAREAGVDIRMGAKVKSVDQELKPGHVLGVTYTDSTRGGEQVSLSATDVVICAGPWTQTVWPSAPISTCRVHSVTIRPLKPLGPHAVLTTINLPEEFSTKTDESLNDSTSVHKLGVATSSKKSKSSRKQIVTPEIFPRLSNEAYISGESDHLVPLPATTDDVQVDLSRCTDIADQVASISDRLRDGEITARQACYLPFVDSDEHQGPILGATDVGGVYLATGHSCWGIQNSTATGKIVSELLFDGRAMSADISRFDPKRICR